MNSGFEAEKARRYRERARERLFSCLHFQGTFEGTTGELRPERVCVGKPVLGKR